MKNAALRGTRYWLLSLAAALVVLVLLGIHMAMMHLDGLLASLVPAWATPLHWAPTLARARSLAFSVGYLLLLTTALYHGFYGLRTLLLELDRGPVWERGVTVGCWLMGGALWVIGSVTTLVLFLSSGGDV
jgi:succinate dehydrogenase / fumarate reductase membrane anchor subunit